METISWHGSLYHHQPDWRAVWTVALVLWAAAILFWLLQSSLITGLFLALLGVMVLLQAKHAPAAGPVELTPAGLRLGDRHYAFSEIRSFWLDYRPTEGVNELSLQLKKWYTPYRKLPLGKQDPVQIRAFLLQFIPEVEQEETLADTLARRLGL